ncbi:hypothetical protein BBP40_000445 [Aspergillus hancockii]|nr:hypothetical protein BBP40_000445 [Aspergillus hancockii]
MLSKTYLAAIEFPKSVQQQGLDVEVLYISQSSPIHACTAESAFQITHTLGSRECALGTLDIVLISSWDIFTPADEVSNFVKGHLAATDTAILAVCAGSFTAAHDGAFEGKTATGPGPLQARLRQQFPRVNWVDQRWAVEGNFWRSSETNGMDMVATFIRQRWPGVLGTTVCDSADVSNRQKAYDQ